MFKLGPRSKMRLEGVHPDLVRVVDDDGVVGPRTLMAANTYIPQAIAARYNGHRLGMSHIDRVRNIVMHDYATI